MARSTVLGHSDHGSPSKLEPEQYEIKGAGFWTNPTTQPARTNRTQSKYECQTDVSNVIDESFPTIVLGGGEKDTFPPLMFAHKYVMPLCLSAQTDRLGGQIYHVLEQNSQGRKVFCCYQHNRRSKVSYDFL
ncbi:MAG: hypothetical protein ACYS30_14885 [Planctomycetota bacterium]